MKNYDATKFTTLLQLIASEFAGELLSSVIWDFQTTRISRKLLIFSIWSMEQKMFLFEHMIDIRDEPARPDPA